MVVLLQDRIDDIDRLVSVRYGSASSQACRLHLLRRISKLIVLFLIYDVVTNRVEA